jgi:hypothetical protein
MTQIEANQVAALVRTVLERNLNNKMTEDLALGVYSNITAGVQQLVVPDKQDGDTD